MAFSWRPRGALVARSRGALSWRALVALSCRPGRPRGDLAEPLCRSRGALVAPPWLHRGALVAPPWLPRVARGALAAYNLHTSRVYCPAGRTLAHAQSPTRLLENPKKRGVAHNPNCDCVWRVAYLLSRRVRVEPRAKQRHTNCVRETAPCILPDMATSLTVDVSKRETFLHARPAGQ